MQLAGEGYRLTAVALSRSGDGNNRSYSIGIKKLGSFAEFFFNK